MSGKRAGHKWTEAESADLIRLLEEGRTLGQIAETFDRTHSGIDSYVRLLRRSGHLTKKRDGVRAVQVSNTKSGYSTGRSKVAVSMPRAPWEVGP